MKRLVSVLLIAACPCVAQFRVSGTVVSEGSQQPIRYAKVALQSDQQEDRRKVLMTGPDGRFTFTDVGAGKYALYAEAPGFAPQALYEHEGFSSAVIVGAGKETERIIFPLPKSAVIRGTVVDEAGEAVRNAQVTLFRKTTLNGTEAVRMVNMKVTDDRGVYQFRNLHSGAYFVAVTARPWYAQQWRFGGPNTDVQPTPEMQALDVVYPITFYGGATDDAAARPIQLHAGARFDADMTLFPTHGIHVRVRGTSGENGVSVTVRRRIFGGWRVPEGSGMSKSDNGDWWINSLSPGKYLVQLQQFQPGQFSVHRGGVGGSRLMVVDITGDTEIDASQSLQPAVVNGVVQLDGASTNAGRISRRMLLFREDNNEARFAVQLDDNGHFKEPVEVAPGRYNLMVAGPGQYVVENVVASGAAKVDGEELEFTSGPASVAVLASNQLADIHGVVHEGGRPLAGTMVMLLPADSSDKQRIRRDQSDYDGSFNLMRVPAGKYRLIAIKNAWDEAWADPDFLAPYLKNAVAVEVGAKPVAGLNVNAQ
jgi:Carboxypeptidase regulatory-like domain